jgi:steroid 5-alpha reductase family enzyme
MTTEAKEPARLARDQAWIAAAYLAGLVSALAAGWLARESHPLLIAALADLAGTVVVFAFSVAFDNSSVYDPYWSVAPIPIALYWAWLGLESGSPIARLALILFFFFVWGVRLTQNWLARWRGMGDEDFRYRRIRERTGRAYWPASFFSIHLMPTIWVFLGMLPAWAALARPGRPFGWLDLVACAVTLAAILIEWLADRQLRRFLRERKDKAEILDKGLWAASRHPNYFGEVLFWWGIFLFGLAAAPDEWWTGVGALSILALFLFVSVPWMDRRMLAGHPEYRRRLETTSGLIPWVRKKP